MSLGTEPRELKSSGLIDLVVAATPLTLWPTQTGRKSAVRKLMIANRSGATTKVQVGFINLAAVFVQVLPDITVLNGFDLELTEDQIPVGGNTPEGYIADATLLTGTNGFISVQATVAGAGAASVQVNAEVEEGE